MNLGERIYELRNKKNLSQGDLADALQVSRQSVSKWENNMAVPDLDKLIKLCDIFEISLDEIVGREKEEKSEVYAVTENYVTPQPKIAGYVLLGVTILSSIILFVASPPAIVLSIPLILCTIICFNAKKHAWFWCIWAMYIPLEFFILLGFRINIRFIIKFAFLIVMAIATWFAFKDIDDTTEQRKRVVTLMLSIIGIVICAVAIWFLFYLNVMRLDYRLERWIFAIISAIITVLSGVGMFQTIRLIHNNK